MPQNRVQYQRGLSMTEFFEQYGTQEQCEAAVRAWRWPDGFVCPRCQGTWASEFARAGRTCFQCCGCRYQCSLLAGTIFQASKLPLSTWFLAIHLLTASKNGISMLELGRHLGVSYPTAWKLRHKLMEVMRQREDGRRLTGRVEIDDAYLGGERSGGKAGRGSENKVPFVAAVQTDAAGNPVLACFAQVPFTKEAVEAFATKSLARPLTVVSDGLACFNAAADAGIHERIVTLGGRTSVKRPEFAAVNTILGNLKTALAGTFHAFKFAKYAHRYLAEFQYRFNRRFDLPAMLKRLAFVACRTRPCPLHTLRSAELRC